MKRSIAILTIALTAALAAYSQTSRSRGFQAAFNELRRAIWQAV